MKKFAQKLMILIVSLTLSISTPILTSYYSYAQQLDKNDVKHVETDTNPMYKGINIKTYSKGSDLCKASSNKQLQVFYSMEDAAQYLKEEMVKRSGTITFLIDKDYYKNLSKDIFNIAVKDDGYTHSSEGDYLYANYHGYTCYSSYYGDYLQMSYDMEYLSTYLQEQAVDREVKKVLDQLNVYDKNDYIKIKSVHDYIAKNIEYDHSLNNHSGYNAIVDKKVVCQGFASITCKMLKELGVGVRYITGNTEEGYHAWNILKINDYWYNTDNTWDACYTEGHGYLDYTWFLKGSIEFNKDHFRDSKFNTLQFKSDFPTSDKSYVYEDEHPVKTFQTFTVNSVKSTSTYISGKGLKGAQVKAYVNNKQIGKTVIVNSSGNYKITIPKQSSGKKIVLKMGKSGYVTKEISTVVLKVFLKFTVNSVKSTSTSISGKGLKGATVKAYINGKQIGKTATVNSAGNYKITIPKQKKNKKITIQMSKSGYSTTTKTITVK